MYPVNGLELKHLLQAATFYDMQLTWPGVIFDCRPFDIFLKADDLRRVDLGLAVIET